MLKRKKQEEENQLINNVKEPTFLRKKSIKELIAPSGIDASNIDHLEIISNVKRYARSFYVSSLPRSCIFPELFRSLYMFGDVNTSIYIKPISEANSQNELNKIITELETERIVAADKGKINRESIIAQKRAPAKAERLIVLIPPKVYCPILVEISVEPITPPKAAPEESPSTPESASGLRKKPCRIAPVPPKRSPQTAAVRVRGSLILNNITE